MTKYLLIGAAALAFATAANAGSPSGSLNDPDGSAHHVTWSGSTPNDDFEDAGSPIVAQFTLKGKVTATCSMMGVDSENPGLNGLIDLGTIGIQAGDELTASQLFNMTGPANVNIHAAGAGCNANNKVTVTKSANGLSNAAAVDYDSNQFQANIPYSADATFTGVAAGAGHVAGTTQHVNVGTGAASASANFGAWRSAFDVNVSIPQVTGKGLVAGTYQDTLTVTLALL